MTMSPIMSIYVGERRDIVHTLIMATPTIHMTDHEFSSAVDTAATLLTAAGFVKEDTGGSIFIWAKRDPNSTAAVCMTDEDGEAPIAGQPVSVEWWNDYDAWDAEPVTIKSFADIADALAAVAL